MSGTKPYHRMPISLAALIALAGPEIRLYREGARLPKEVRKPKKSWKEVKAEKKARRKAARDK